MKNKKVQAMLATAIISATLAGGCVAFDPAEEEMAEVYGPAPYEEEVIISEEEEEKEEQVSENDIFEPEVEMEVCVYGPAPTE